MMQNDRATRTAKAARTVGEQTSTGGVPAPHRAGFGMRGVASLAFPAALAVLAACSARDGGAAEVRADSAARAAQPAAATGAPGGAAAQGVDWKQVDQAMGRAGTMQDDGAYKYNMPRSDLHVTVNGIAVKPALSLGSWLAMKPAANGVVAMGDLVLTESEVTPVIVKLQAGGVMQTALHNHLLHERPRVMYLHVHGAGDPVQIAQAVRNALAATGTPAAAASGAGSGAASAPPFPLDTAAIHQALGRGGSVSGGVYHVTAPRAEVIRAAGIDVPPSMGTATSINFQPTGRGKAAINGDFVMIASEVNDVIAALEDGGINVVAVHNHMLGEEPRLFFLHYWANDDAVKLAKGLRAALDKTNTKTPGK